MLKRFAGTVAPTTLYKAYRTAIKPIALLYSTDFLYENLSVKVLESYNHLKFTAIKTAYQLPRDTPIPDCLPYLLEGGIGNRILRRREKFLERNSNSILLRHGESTTFSQGRRIRVRMTHRDRSVKTVGWKSSLTIHQPNTFLSDVQPLDIDTPNISSTNSFIRKTFRPPWILRRPFPSLLLMSPFYQNSSSNRNTPEWNFSHHPQQWKTT